MPRQPWIADKRTAVLLGLMLFVAGAIVLWDAYERRGGRAPWPLRAFLPT
jgi:hypothetical protein